ncbi:hypothetical protein KJ652_00735 [Patescibacteria group bacterium]|nr:hypothetical protein [Patescibacteria group bacterium]
MKKSLLLLTPLALLVIACTVEPDKPLADPQQHIPDAEQEFNDSGRAKAIKDETDLWMFFEDPLAGFSIKYPHNVNFGSKNENELRLRIESAAIDGLEGTMGYNEETAVKNRASLLEGDYGEEVDFPLEVSKKVTEIDGVNAQEFMVLGRFEVCDVTFERKAYFFNEDHQIVITLAAADDAIIEEHPEFFETNPENCGDMKVWNFDRQETFYKTLENSQGKENTQEWFDTFEKIMGTVEFVESV